MSKLWSWCALLLVGILLQVLVQANEFGVTGPYFDPTEFNNFESSMTVTYDIGNGSTTSSYPDTVEVDLFAADCDSSADDDGLIAIVSEPYDSSSEFQYDIFIDPTLISSSDLVVFTGPSTSTPSSGSISFCTRVTTFLSALPDVIIGLNYTNWNIDFDISSNSFDSTDYALTSIAIDESNIDITSDLTVIACPCNDSGTCIETSYVNGAVLGLCLTPSSGTVEISSFDLTLSKSDFSYTPVQQVDSTTVIVSDLLTFTDKINTNTIYIETILVGGLFVGVEEQISISGSATTKFIVASKALGKTSKSHRFLTSINIIQGDCLLQKALTLFK